MARFMSECGLGVEASVLLNVLTVHHLSTSALVLWRTGGGGVWGVRKEGKGGGVDEGQVSQCDVTWEDIP